MQFGHLKLKCWSRLIVILFAHQYLHRNWKKHTRSHFGKYYWMQPVINFLLSKILSREKIFLTWRNSLKFVINIDVYERKVSNFGATWWVSVKLGSYVISLHYCMYVFFLYSRWRWIYFVKMRPIALNAKIAKKTGSQRK